AILQRLDPIGHVDAVERQVELGHRHLDARALDVVLAQLEVEQRRRRIAQRADVLRALEAPHVVRGAGVEQERVRRAVDGHARHRPRHRRARVEPDARAAGRPGERRAAREQGREEDGAAHVGNTVRPARLFTGGLKRVETALSRCFTASRYFTALSLALWAASSADATARFRPLCLAWYSAWSALAISVLESRPSSG